MGLEKMVKNYEFKEGSNHYLTKVQLIPTKGVNLDKKEGTYYLLKISSHLYQGSKLISTMNKVILPVDTGDLKRDEIHKGINFLNEMGTNYQYGTYNQYYALKEKGYNTNELIIKNAKECINILKEKDLYFDNDIEFGKKLFIGELPEDIITIFKAI